MMKIDVFYNVDAEPWGILTHGHVSKELFLAAARKNDEAAAEIEFLEGDRKITIADVSHSYMSQSGEGIDVVGDPLWVWCAADDSGAVAVTAIEGE